MIAFCLLFAAAKTKAAELRSGRLSNQNLGCSKRTSRALRRFLLRTLLLLRCHNATPSFLMNLIRQGLSSRLRRQITAKQWCIINEPRMNRSSRVVSVGSHAKVDQRLRACDRWTTCWPSIRLRRTASSTRRLISTGGRDIQTILDRVRPSAYYCRLTPVKRVDQHEQ